WELTELPPGFKALRCKWILKRKMKVDRSIDKYKARLVIQGFRQKEGIAFFDTYAPIAWITTIRLLFDASGKGVIIWVYVDDILIFGTDQDQVDKTKEFLSSKFDMKDLGEAEVILGIRIKRGNKVSELGYSSVVGCLMYAMISTRPDIAFAVDSTMESEFVALAAAGKEAEWLRNLVYEIPLWPKPISTISIRCDSATTLAKAYSQVYNGKSRHLGVRHSMICELIMNGVISVEFVKTQLNLADHLTKGLTRDLVHKVAIGMGLKST
nr:zinc finger, CCHC-type [Tanacetum cinerariifolium]